MGKFVEKKVKAKKGQNLIIREAQASDAQEVLTFIKKMFETASYTLTSPGEFRMTLEQEELFLQNYYDSDVEVFLLALHENKIVGNLGLHGSLKKRDRHRVLLGMGVDKNWRNKGVGRLLLENTISYCKKNPLIKKLELGVIEQNKGAYALYQKMGFVEEGRSLKGFYSDEGKYLDEIKMGIWCGDDSF